MQLCLSCPFWHWGAAQRCSSLHAPPPTVPCTPSLLSLPGADLRFEVTARRSDSSAGKRGIYLRDPQDSKQAMTFQ